MLTLWLGWFALVLGLYMLWSQELWLFSLFLIAGYSAVLVLFVRTVRSWKDVFNPLCVIVAIGLIRFGLPGLLLLLGVNPQSEFITAMGLTTRHWQLGHVLALTGLVAMVLGWGMTPRRLGRMPRLQFRLPSGVGYAALAATLVGFAALLAFVGSNTSITEVVSSGGFRGTTIQVGTGKFFFLSYFLISGSVILSGYLLTRRSRLKWASLVPVTLAMLSFWVLGGRGRALTPFFAGLLLLWYLGREQKRWHGVSMKSIVLPAVVGIPLLVWSGYFGQLYRGGMGLGGFLQSLSPVGLWQYLQWSIFSDMGQLHVLAGAVVLEPGILAGTTFVHRLLWPLSQVLGLPGRSSGIVIVESLVGLGTQRWGLGVSLIGDAYVNFGVAGVPIVMGLFGAVLKMVYARFRRGSMRSVSYVFAAVYSAAIFITGIDAWIHASIVLAFTLLIISLGRIMLRGRVEVSNPRWRAEPLAIRPQIR